MKRKQEKDNSNKIELLQRDEDGFIDLDLVDDDSDNCNLPETNALDANFYQIFTKVKVVIPSDKVEERVMEFYRKEYSYSILKRKVKLKLKEWTSVREKNGVVLAFATAVVLLFILSGAMYYKYIIMVNPVEQVNQVSNSKEGGKTKIPDVTNSTPQPTKVLPPNIPDNNKKKNISKPKPMPGLEIEENKLASNTTKLTRNKLRTFEATPVETTNKRLKLESIKKVYVGDLIRIQENREWILTFFDELKISIREYWEIEEQQQEAAMADVAFKIENNRLILKDKMHKTLWISKLELDPETNKPREIASKIVNELKQKIGSKLKSDVNDLDPSNK